MARVYCNTIIGTAAEGATYFSRDRIERRILHELRKGQFVHFTAPRRVGKTSILKAIASRDYDDLICIFENIESDRYSADLYKRLIKLIEKALSKKKALWEKALSYLNSKKIKGVSVDGVDLDHGELDYKKLFLDLVDALQETEVRVVLLVDEFPDVISNIYRNEDREAALDVLNTIRSVRQTKEFKRSFGLVLSGSVGLTHVIRNIGRSKLINDLHKIPLEPLSGSQCDAFIDFLSDGATLQIPQPVRDHIKERLQQYIPYYIQLVVEGGDVLTDDQGRIELSIEDVDHVYDKLTKDNDKFIDWVDRIRDYHSKDYGFLKAVLTITAHDGGVTIQSIANIAAQLNTVEYEELVHQVLIKDGYLTKDEMSYTFASPLLRDWWKYHYSNH